MPHFLLLVLTVFALAWLVWVVVYLLRLRRVSGCRTVKRPLVVLFADQAEVVEWLVRSLLGCWQAIAPERPLILADTGSVDETGIILQIIVRRTPYLYYCRWLNPSALLAESPEKAEVCDLRAHRRPLSCRWWQQYN